MTDVAFLASESYVHLPSCEQGCVRAEFVSKGLVVLECPFRVHEINIDDS